MLTDFLIFLMDAKKLMYTLSCDFLPKDSHSFSLLYSHSQKRSVFGCTV